MAIKIILMVLFFLVMIGVVLAWVAVMMHQVPYLFLTPVYP